MSGGRFLASLREIHSSKRILKCRELLTSGIDYWKEIIENASEKIKLEQKRILSILKEKEEEIMEVSLCNDSEEVSQYIAGNFAIRIIKQVQCDECKSYLVKTTDADSSSNEYMKTVSHGGLTIPSQE